MDLANTTTEIETKELVEAQAHIWNHNYSFQNSMALKCAVQLGIPDAIHKHGQPMTLTELARAISIHPTKAPSLHRLMRLLVHSNFFSEDKSESHDQDPEPSFGLTINSQLLLTNHPLSLAPFVLNTLIDHSLHFSKWFTNDDCESPFQIAYGRSIWEHAGSSGKFNDYFNRAMASDARLVSTVLLKRDEAKEIFEGIESMVDVGGGYGVMAKAIAEAYPGMNCTVLDLPHVVEGVQGSMHNVVYQGGDMFKAIPPAQAILLKSILHDWSDENCIKILRRCKEAIASKSQGGKVIIIDMVMEEHNHNTKCFNTQVLFDLQMMSFCGGKERTEGEWKKLFADAGFIHGYKIFRILGLRSVIEVYS